METTDIEQIQVNLPKLGESILSATIVHWFKKEGDLVRLDEPLLEVATDKINSEIPSPCEGVVVKIHAQKGQELKVGELLVTLMPQDKAASCTVVEKNGSFAKEKIPESKGCPFATKEELPFQVKNQIKNEKEALSTSYLSPAVLRLANEFSLPLDVLQKIPGTGEEGRITKLDVENFIRRKQEAPKREDPKPVKPSASITDEEVILPLSPLRKIIAENMEKSYKEIPHAYLVQEVDVTLLQEKIREMKEDRSKKKLPKLTLTSVVMYALGKILQRFPLLNASFGWDGIRVKKSFHCGMAVSVEQGVVVPVVKNVELLTLDEVAGEIQLLAENARSSKLQPGQTQGGTFTLTNFGMSGIALGFPIIKAPEAAILALGALQNKVVALTDKDFGIREMMQITLAFDHRIFDGIYACQFLKELQLYLENPFHDSRISL